MSSDHENMKCQICHHPGVDFYEVCSICEWRNDASLEIETQTESEAKSIANTIPGSKIEFGAQARITVTWLVDFELDELDLSAWSSVNSCTPNQFRHKRLESIFNRLAYKRI